MMHLFPKEQLCVYLLSQPRGLSHRYRLGAYAGELYIQWLVVFN
jgi:hypothetical protein